MDQVEIDRVAAELFGALVERPHRFVEAVVRIAEFRRHEDVRPAEQGLADAILVSIHRRGVDQAIAFVDRELDHLLRRIGRRLKDPEPKLGHRSAVVEGDGRLGRTGHFALSRVSSEAPALPKSPRSASERGGGAKARRGALYRSPDAIPARPLGNRAAWTPTSLRLTAARTRSRRRQAASRLPAAIRTLFHPAVAAWFAASFAAPTPAQAEAWPAIQAGRHTLIAAPTGSGKTLAAFLAAIDELVRQGLDGGARRRDAGRLRLAAEGAVQRHPPQPRGAARRHPRASWRRAACPTSRSAPRCAPATRRRRARPHAPPPAAHPRDHAGIALRAARLAVRAARCWRRRAR